MEFCHLELELSGYNKEVAALHSDHYTQVQLYYSVPALLEQTQACNIVDTIKVCLETKR